MKEDNLENIAQRLELPYVPLTKETTEERIADALEYIAYRLYKIDVKLGARWEALPPPMDPAV
jgi:hypothetical protein